MIAEQYINEGIRIRRAYIYNLKKILEQESTILDRKIVIEKLQIEMDTIVNSDLNEIRKTLELNSKLQLLDKEMKIIQDKIKPYDDEIERLRSDSDKLYLMIREKYPNMTASEIENEIMSKVEE